MMKMKHMLMPLFLLACMAAGIPAQTHTASPAEGLGIEEAVMRRDPSDIIKVEDLYYVWYTRHTNPEEPSGYDATVWYATSPDGHTWTEKGEALPRGPEGSWDEHSVFTPNILVAEGQYWLFYTAVPEPFFNRGENSSRTAIGLAVSDSPDGPWKKMGTAPVLKAGEDPSAFDSHRVDDACLIVRDGKYWMYYKGRQRGKSPGQTRMGVAISGKPEGPYIKDQANPVIRGGHEVVVWPEGAGVTALIGKVGPRGIRHTLQYAPDGVTFTKQRNLPHTIYAAGTYRPEAFTDSGMGRMPEWGLHIGPKETRRLPFLERFDFSIKEEKTASRPNVLFILMDDLGYSDVSCYGAKKVKTPHIDQLAAEGIRFTDFHTAASICSPSRAAFLTGAYPQRCGTYMGLSPAREAHWFLGLNPEEITLAEVFKKKGYTTLMVGKWHLGTEEKFSCFNQGFDHYYGAPSNMSHDPRLFDGEELVFAKTPLNRLTELYTARIVRDIGVYKDRPFFLYYAHNYPHTPYKPGPAFAGSSTDGKRGDVIQELDWSIGQIVKALKQHGILDNTLIVFTSDNGPVKNEYARPYRGTKYVSLEGGHRVPFILYWKGRITKPAASDVPVNAMDLFPTLCEIIGEPLPDDRTYDGTSLTPLFNQRPLARKDDAPFYYYNCENLQAVRVKNWKLHLPRTEEQLPFWEHGRNPVTKPLLYNLAEDKGEGSDLSAKHPGIVAQLKQLAEMTRIQLGEYGRRGSEQRPAGSLFPEVPVIGNDRLHWDQLSDAEKGRAKTEFKAPLPKSKKEEKTEK
jgi:arylsulfatase